ncbi:unnamed protein product, partial [Effrenium voratum]
MARKSRGRGGGRGGSGGRGGRGRARSSGIEQYGQDEADEFLALDESGQEEDEDDMEEEDVMALKPYGEEPAVKDKKKKKKDKKKTEESESEDLAPASKGWGRNDFYGGEDAEDDSGSDEERTLKEARKLDELRASRLQELSDPLTALLGPEATLSEEKSAQPDAEQFEAMFAEEAEKGHVDRDLSQLSEAKRKSLLKKEAPELMPLLEDFQQKLAALSPLLPLLKAPLPLSGAAYLEAKVSLLLNHLANLSFYLLMKSEGGEVKSHPVVSQLVWLRQLDELIKPLDQRLKKSLHKAAKVAKKLPREEAPRPPAPPPEAPMPQPAAPKAPATLAERLEKLRKKQKPAEAAADAPAGATRASAAPASVASLLKLPAAKRRAASNGPEDLEEIDPT